MNDKVLLVGFLFVMAVATVTAVQEPVVAQEQIVYSLTIRYDGQNLFNESIRLIEGTAPGRIEQPDVGFTLKVISFDGEVLHSFKFPIETTPMRDMPDEFFDESGTQIDFPKEPPRKYKETEIVLVVPYFSNAKSIDIFDESDRLLLSIDVSQFSVKPGWTLDPLLIGGIGIVILVIVGGVLYLRSRK